MMDLQRLYADNAALFGPKCENLGKKSGWYLKYEDGQWSLKYLNCIQRILRNCFGFYVNTHLKFVANKILRDAPDPLINKIRSSWRKVYPTEAVPIHLEILVSSWQKAYPR